jgi:hypothetical protein
MGRVILRARAGVMQTGQVFVSNTSDRALFPAGRSFVQGALVGAGRTGMAPVDMRYFAARDGSPAEYCRQRVAECEIYVAVVGFRYGSLVPGAAAYPRHSWITAAYVAGLIPLALNFFMSEAMSGDQAAITAVSPHVTGAFTVPGISYLQHAVVCTFTDGHGSIAGGSRTLTC